MKNKSLSYAWIILVAGILLILFFPFLLTRKWGLIDFSNTGQIGDTIGGITAPISGLIGSVLVYFALKAQIEANQLIQRQIEEQKQDESQKRELQYLFDQFKIIREDINDFVVVELQRTGHDSMIVVEKKNREAVDQVLSNLRSTGTIKDIILDPDEVELISILTSLISLLKSINTKTLPAADKEFLKGIISYQFYSKIKGPFEKHLPNSNRELKRRFPDRDKIRGIPDDLYDMVNEIEILLNT